MAHKILINYRREDSSAWAGRLYDRMTRDFGQRNVFIDIDGIKPGLDFIDVLDAEVAGCDVCLAVIGKGWLDARDKDGNRRLDSPHDFVRAEIESSLRQGKTVIPVLVDGASMPASDQLPEGIKPFANRQAITVSHLGFRADAAGLVAQIRRSRAGDLSPHGAQLLIAGLFALFGPLFVTVVGGNWLSKLLTFERAGTDLAEGTVGSIIAAALVFPAGIALLRRRKPSATEQERTLFNVGFALVGCVLVTKISWVLVSTFGGVGPAHWTHLMDHVVGWLFLSGVVYVLFASRNGDLSDTEWMVSAAAIGVLAYVELSFIYTILIANDWLPEWASSSSEMFASFMAALAAGGTAGLAVLARRQAPP